VLPKPCAELVAQCREAGVLVVVSAENRIRLLPPLVITAEEADHLVKTVSGVVRAFLGGSAA
jgi:acetylornithine aminotransferase